MENLVIINSEEEFDTLIRTNDVVLVDFYADWCSPCVAIHPVLKSVAAEFAGKAVVAKVNVDEQQGLAEKFAVTSIPALFYFKSGQLSSKSNGLKTATQLSARLNQLLG